MTQDNWIKALLDLHSVNNNMYIGVGGCDDCLEWDDAIKELTDFISQVEKDAIEKTKQEFYDAKQWQQSLNMAREKGYLEGVEKTNKRWRERIGEKAEKRLWTNTVANNMHVVKKYHQGINDLVSDLLEDK